MIVGIGRFARLAFAILALFAVAGCSTTTPRASVKAISAPNVPATKEAAGKEYFSEKAYGVKASPRVSGKRTRLRRGGGRYQVGKPYKIRGKWYYPKEEPGYVRTGLASWYGDAFHGRLTANGEVYDMTHLTAAHPTMPLPSYARVTNVANGATLIVRVNDRGPYSRGRVIDLSRRAAELLDYKHSGVAKVKVEYVGPAPLEGENTETLMASYNSGNASPTGVSGVAIAMADTSLSQNAKGLPGVGESAFAPIANANEKEPLITPSRRPSLSLSYASTQTESRSSAFNAHDLDGSMSANTIHIGMYDNVESARKIGIALRKFGIVTQTSLNDTGNPLYNLELRVTRSYDADAVLQQVWEMGAVDAFWIRQ